jgi:hypothetical protein
MSANDYYNPPLQQNRPYYQSSLPSYHSQVPSRPPSATSYYGQGGGGRQGSITSFHDDIPLRDHPGGPQKDTDTTDHVYDAAEPAVPTQRRNLAKQNGRSPTYFMQAPKKRIPWVVYIMTAIQVSVFTGEVVKNGKYFNAGFWQCGADLKQLF